jgi:hypothetical protein
MKVIVMLCMLALPIVSTASTNEYRKLAQQLEGLTEVDGSAVGARGTPGRFYKLSLDILAKGSKPDFQRMLSSTNPVVRLMGVYSLVNTHTNMSELWLPATLFSDTTKVLYAPGGCGVMYRTVSDIAYEFIRNPQCLGASRRKK